MGTSFMKRVRHDGSLMRAARASSQARAWASTPRASSHAPLCLQAFDQHQPHRRLALLDLAELREIGGRAARQDRRLGGAPLPEQRARDHAPARRRATTARRASTSTARIASACGAPEDRRPRPGSPPGRCAPPPPGAARPARRSCRSPAAPGSAPRPGCRAGPARAPGCAAPPPRASRSPMRRRRLQRLPQRRLGALEVAELAVEVAQVAADRAGVAHVARLLERHERRSRARSGDAPRSPATDARTDAHLVHQRHAPADRSRDRSPASSPIDRHDRVGDGVAAAEHQVVGAPGTGR